MKTKRIFTAILILAVVAGLLSCTGNASIVGRWQYKGKEADVEATQPEVAAVVEEQYATRNQTSQLTLSLGADSIFEINTPEGYNDRGAYTYQKGVLTLSSERYGKSFEYTVAVKGSTLKLGVDIIKRPATLYPPINAEELGITTYIEYEVYERMP